MKYDVCIVGHGRFPDGVKSAIKLLAGANDGITCFNLDEDTTHEAFKAEMTNFLIEHEHVLVFADMTGGAPFQITAQLILESNAKNQFIVSSISMNAVLDLFLKDSMNQLNPDNIQEMIRHVITESCKLMQAIPNDEIKGVGE